MSLLTLKDDSFEVKATAGDTHLGGENLDNRMVSHFVKELKRKNNVEGFGHEHQPDEAVAYGAAVQAALLNEGIKNATNVVLQDITPLSLGILTKGDITSVVIPKNIHVKTTEGRCKTSADTQFGISINVYEGERVRARENNLLGLLNLLLPRAPRVLMALVSKYDLL